MLERILSKENMTKAFHRVKMNKGACGVDGMKTSELRSYLNQAWVFVKVELLDGTYQPQAVRRVEIPKANGGIRMLGIPTVIDRLIQQAISQELGLLWEDSFSDNSFGFRPNRNAHQAVERSKSYLNEGNTYIVDIDLEKFFDTVNQDYLMHLLGQRVADKRVLGLIGKYLRAGVMKGGVVTVNTEGTPQGSPLSPLLSNILLDVLDKELESRGHKFVRYADDFSIYSKSKRGAERIMGSIAKFIEKKLHLRVNQEKSGLRRPSKMTILGFGYYAKTKGTWSVRIAPKSLTRFKEKIRQLTQRRITTSTSDRIDKMKAVLMGWVSYFKIADCKQHLRTLDEWIRSRLRMCEWKLWKRVRTRMKRLVSLGISKNQAYQWANSRKGHWRTAHSPILLRSLNIEWFDEIGYAGLLPRYEKLRTNSK